MRTFDYPTILAQTTAMLGPALGDHGLDTAFAQRATMSGGIVAAIGVDDAGLLKRSATNAANGWNRINERQQLRDVVGVRPVRIATRGTPLASTRTWCLEPGRARSVGFGPVFRPPQRRARTTNRPQRMTVDLAGRTQLVEKQLVQLVPYTSLLPVAQSPPACGARAKAQTSRQVVPTNSRFEHEQDAVESRTVGHARATRIALRSKLRRWQQWFDQYPQFVVNDWRFHPWTSVVLMPKVNSLPRK